MKLTEDPHRRLNALTNEWVLVSPHRATRPWQGEVAKLQTTPEPTYDPNCYLCPGNARAGGIRNPAYSSTFVFENDFAALKPQTRPDRLDIDGKGLAVAEAEPGVCRVICFSPRHDLTLATMGLDEIERVVGTWTEQFRELGALKFIKHVQIFENRGAMMGASNPHPHCQIWATASIPDAPAKELIAQRAYFESRGSCLLCDYVALEERQQVRVVCQNEGFVALVPFWAVWPFEILVCSRRHMSSMNNFGADEPRSLSAMLQQITSTYDRVFGVPFPYSMGFHQSPTDGADYPEWHFHAHFYPPLLRSATIRKFMVGFEMLGMPQRDITPETAAERLRELVRR
ncbi:Galactose-1-phosphate uridylyltransferase [Candidatus Sulfotelmatobacter kueseliae]|uniref:Galactose-1-phosphate uridylyltransferase n=1 Tax=Candidatus Sulfotelmatobacter kueseliae TaxID=2042962 RepID=A0A2U3LDD7_9BACT|nr:Galactose-1-phosphate uridylyltransferase [Candidatus Sulfotelmatobacter kueseliae]